MRDRIGAVAVDVVRISDKTCWIFVTLRSEEGFAGVGEATLFGREHLVLDAVRARRQDLIGAPAEPSDAQCIAPVPLPQAAAASAIAQALFDLAARRAGRRLVESLGGAVRETVPLYANINRRTRDRTPDGFARSAREALAAGHLVVKLAPFDAVTPEVCRAGEAAAGIAHGLACVAAVRDAVGPGCEVMVDCHWRLDEARAAAVIREAADIGVVWVECPVPETIDSIPAIRRLRALANGRGLRLAGCEELAGLESFMPFIAGGAYDVLMPDVKYCGGPADMMRLAEVMEKHNTAFSPHNPSGPICHAASLHAAAAASKFDRLEVQFDEAALFGKLVREEVPPCMAGQSALPGGAGIGLTLDPAVVAGARISGWSSDNAEAGL